MENSNTIKIYSGKRKWYEIALASVFYTITVYTLLYLIYYLVVSYNTYQALIKLFEFLYYGAPSLASALAFSITKDVEIEVKTNNILSYYKVGPFTKVIKTKALEFEYVSVFYTDFDVFQTNLWYKGNKHYKMYEFDNKNGAFTFGKVVSDKLNIDLLDATERGNNKWVNKSEL